MNNDMGPDKFLETYLQEMAKVGNEIFGIHYLDEYVNKFPVDEQDNVRDSLVKLSESLHSGHNAGGVILLVNKCLIKTWLETNDVRDGYGNLLNNNKKEDNHVFM